MVYNIYGATMKRPLKQITLLIFAIGTLLVLAPSNMPTPTPSVDLPPQKPEATSSHQSSDKTPSSQATNTVSQQPKPTQPTTAKTPSPTLKSYPNAPQIPYYLTGSVNDPYFGSSWALNKVQANRGWDLTTGSASTTVAVIDTGFELNHEDLAERWKINQNEVGQTQNGDSCWTDTPQDKSKNNCDDDANGYIDDYRGYDFFNNDNSPRAGEVNPNGEAIHHGSMVAGVVGATANNNKGSAGIDQNSKILPLQIFSDDGEASTNHIVSAIDYATDQQVDVINLSLGSNQFDQVLLTAILRAFNNNIVVVASSGNCALNDEDFCNSLSAPGRMTYPALFSEVLSVGATTNSDQRANYSSYGTKLDIVAPGSSVGPLPVYNNGSTNSYASGSGTSFSAPLVSGLASLLLAQNPNLTPSQIESILTESADVVPSMYNAYRTDEYGFGRINAHKTTLLNLAKIQDSLLGGQIESPNQPAVGNIWRSGSGNLGSDEVVLIGCRLFASQTCGATIQNNGTYWLRPKNYQSKGGTQYIFAPSNSAPNGIWQVSVHNNQYATFFANLTK